MSEIIVDSSHERRILDFRLLGFCDVLILGHYVYRKTRSPLQFHDHGDLMEICYLAEGRQFYRVADKDYFLSGGDVLINYPHECHGTSSFCEGKGNLYWLILQPPSLRSEFLGMSRGKGKILYENIRNIPSRQFKLKSGSQKNLEQIFASFDEVKNSDYPNPSFVKTSSTLNGFKSLETEHGKHSITKRLVQEQNLPSIPVTLSLFVMNIQNHLLRFLLDLAESAQLRSPAAISTGIQPAIDRITDDDETFYTMKQLARVAGLSESRFKHRFREEVGTTPADYQLRHKIDRACQMLIQDNTTILDTALSLGFSSSQYFATVFRRYVGVTPTEYRTIMK